MSNVLEYRRLQHGDIPKVLELQKQVFGVPWEADYLDWKYFQYSGGEHTIFIALDGDVVVGQSGGIPVILSVGQKEVKCVQEVDIAVLPEYQKKRVFFRVAKHSGEWEKKEETFNLAFSIKRTYRIITKMLKFRGVCSVFKIVKIVDPTPFIQKKVKIKFLASILGYLGKTLIRVWFGNSIPSLDGRKIEEIKRFDQRFDVFWNQVVGDYEIITVRNSLYLNWRYIDNPSEYKVFAVIEDELIKGYVVLSSEKEDVFRGNIVDILVSPSEHKVAELLIRKAIAYFDSLGVAVISCWQPEHLHTYSILKKNGFIKRETENDFVIRSYLPNTPNERFLDEKKWYFSMGDSDYY